MFFLLILFKSFHLPLFQQMEIRIKGQQLKVIDIFVMKQALKCGHGVGVTCINGPKNGGSDRPREYNKKNTIQSTVNHEMF